MQVSDVLDRYTKTGVLFEKLEENKVRCQACAHRCLLLPGKRGICGVRFNQEGDLQVPSGYVAGVNVDPIEKKPFNHFLPGRGVLTFGMLGCNFHCSFCQNWYTSQALREPQAASSVGQIMPTTARELVTMAVEHGAAAVASSYNEPLISSEWAVEIFEEAKAKQLKTVMISNGFATPETLKFLRPWLDGYKIDLKSMQEERYKEMGGRLGPVLDSIRLAKELGLWVEVVTLVIPGFNDSVDELWKMSEFLTSVSADIPWHVTAYHPDYLMNDAPPTPAATLQRAAEVGEEAGLHFVYAGNLPGKVGSLEDTYCPKCRTRLVQRRGYWIRGIAVTSEGKCPNCGQSIPGIWN